MTPLIVYITRPTAYEIYMGGKRDISVWWDRPSYSHQSRSYELCGKTHYVDDGWRAAFGTGQRAKLMFEQDERLLEVVWPEIFLSICPKGMTYEQGLEWSERPDPTAEDPGDRAYRQLFYDRQWEAKCNTCHKRFLLTLDLRSYEVQRIQPAVNLRFNPGWFHTDHISDKLAVEYYHGPDDIDDVPF